MMKNNRSLSPTLGGELTSHKNLRPIDKKNRELLKQKEKTEHII